jgi:prepilin-type N-terminal cleavage/methylation domain-containing protein
MSLRASGPIHARAQGGFTLVEVLVVMLVLGSLAAIAIPLFLGQTEKGLDASAKADVNYLAKLIEECKTQEDSYRNCDEQSELEGGSQVNWGAGAGRSATVDVTDDSYYAYTISKATTGDRNHVFAWQRDAGGVTTWFCLKGIGQPVNSATCHDSEW